MGEKYCGQINFYLNELTCVNKRKEYNIKNKFDVDFNPLKILDFLIQILLSSSKKENFILFMAKDIRSYKSENIKFATEKIFKSNLITKSKYSKLIELTKMIDKKRIKILNRKIPTEFCDPLLDCEIMIPVFLPNTDVIMEKSVILRHLLTNSNNPFNRDYLTKEILEKYNSKSDIKKKISNFILKKSEWEKKFN